jgi:spermidine/putrescine transport system permease protein
MTTTSPTPSTFAELDAMEARSVVGAGGPAKRKGRLGDRLLFLYTWLVILWLCAPVFVMILFSFNDLPKGARVNTSWDGFTLRWYSLAQINKIPNLAGAVAASLEIAVLSTVITTLLGTFIGIAIGKYRFRGQGSMNLLLFAAISAPETVLGGSLLTLFATANVGTGFITILIAHVMFSLAFVAVVVRARVLTLDPSIEEAAFDLGASWFTTFRRVTLPMIFPAILSGALLAFVLSIDDYVVTSFTSGPVTTFPLWIAGASKLGLPPQVNVVGTLIFPFGVLIAVANAVASRRRAAR